MSRKGRIYPKVLVTIVASNKLKSHGQCCSCAIGCVCRVVSWWPFEPNPQNVNLLLMIRDTWVASTKTKIDFSYCKSVNKSIFLIRVAIPKLIIVPSCRLKGCISSRGINVYTLPHSIRINPNLLSNRLPLDVIRHRSWFRYSVIYNACLFNRSDTAIIIDHCSSVGRF